MLRRLDFFDHPDVQKSFVREDQQTLEASLLLENIRCAACLWLNERVLRGLDGVLDVDLDYTSHHARVRWDPTRIKLSEILESIINIGYVAHPYDATRREELNKLQQQRSGERLIFAGIIGMVVMNFAIAGYVMGYGDETGELALWVKIGRWTSLFAATALLAYPGQEFFVGAWRDLRNRRLGMDVPIVLGLSVAWLGSLHTTITQQGEVYYDSIAMFVFLVLLARRIELRGRLRAADALDRVGRIQPRLARRLQDGTEHEVLVTELDPGDRVRLLPGEIVPTDCILLGPSSSFDESLLTGESLPVTRHPGDPLTGGSCNIEQAVEAEITCRSDESALAEIHRLLSRGLREAPRYAILAQKVAGWFVAVVLAIAATTATIWLLIEPAEALRNTVAVLIVTCPCALALATPVAAAIGVGRFADNGLLATRGDALEVLAQAEVFAFDKTGTLTSGELQIAEILTFNGATPAMARRVAAALERTSEHPIGRALYAAGGETSIVVEDHHNHIGRGVSGKIDGREWRLGKPAFALPSQLDADFEAALRDLQQRADTVVALHDENGATALFGLRDSLRDGVETMIEGLRKQGVRHIALLSGDQPVSVERFAAGRGFDSVHSDLAPADKLAWIHQQQAAGHRVVMVGDGINDAPTLASADTSISFTHASELAQVSSDLLVLRGDLAMLADMRQLARRTRTIIRQNLAWAASYNFLAVPFAALGFIAPWGAAIGMSLSSLLVVANALRLRRH
jgi:Cu2+-exporting ATPase